MAVRWIDTHSHCLYQNINNNQLKYDSQYTYERSGIERLVFDLCLISLLKMSLFIFR